MLPFGLRDFFAAVHKSLHGTNLPFAAVQNCSRLLGHSGQELLDVRLSQFDPSRNAWLRTRG
jgi:hypothetical protein